MPHIVSSALVYIGGAAVWYPDAKACVACDIGIDDDIGAIFGPAAPAGGATSDTDAVAIDNRDRTRSNGYVEPEKKAEHPNQ
jgi:hypothetical protein